MEVVPALRKCPGEEDVKIHFVEMNTEFEEENVHIFI